MGRITNSDRNQRDWQELRRYAAARYGTGDHLVPHLSGHPAQVSEARRFLAGILGDRTAAADAVLCLSELATSAIQHSRSAGPRGQFSVRAELDGGGCGGK